MKEQNRVQGVDMEEALPFRAYPGQGRVRLGSVKGSNCRHEYGLMFLRQTSQTQCAYCGQPMLEDYRVWLTMALDHVVPVKTGQASGIPVEWLEDSANKVLACTACNTFHNRYSIPADCLCPTTLDEFFDLRDQIFRERRKLVAACHASERAFFESKPWLKK